MTRRHHSQPRDAEIARGLAQIAGKAAAPAITLNRMYHCVPEDHQRRQPDVRVQAETDDQHDEEREQQIGREGGEELRQRLRRAAPRRGRSPSQTPIGTQISVARIISTTTRSMVMQPSSTALSTSPQLSVAATRSRRCCQSRAGRRSPRAPNQDARRSARDGSPRRSGPARGRARQPQPADASDATADSGRRRAAAVSAAAASASRICGRRAARSSRSGTSSTRRPAAGTGAGRRAMITSSMARIAQTTAPMSRCSSASAT